MFHKLSLLSLSYLVMLEGPLPSLAGGLPDPVLLPPSCLSLLVHSFSLPSSLVDLSLLLLFTGDRDLRDIPIVSGHMIDCYL